MKQAPNLTRPVTCVECRKRTVYVEPARRAEGVVCLDCINRKRVSFGLKPVEAMYRQTEVPPKGA